MSTILLGWELGEGLGHVAHLLEVARELAAHGHSPVLAVKDFAVARVMLRDVPFPVLRRRPGGSRRRRVSARRALPISWRSGASATSRAWRSWSARGRR